MENIIRTENEGWGFYGTWILAEPGIDVERAWDTAVTIILENNEERTPEYARDFLDSRMGRHFADRVHEQVLYNFQSLEQAIGVNVEEFLGWYDKAVEREIRPRRLVEL